MTQIQVDKGNPYYCSVDGVLYSAEMDVLLSYPAGKRDTHFTVPSSVTVIETGAFGCANYLNSVDLPKGLITICDSAFSGCANLETLVIPSTVQEIWGNAFENCYGLQSITIPASVRNMGTSVFYGCVSLTEIQVEKGNAYYYSDAGVLFTADGKTLMAYPACKADNAYVIPASVGEIAWGAFAYAENLQKVVMPSGLKSIPNYAFAWCYNLSSVTLPVSINYIGVNAFRNNEILAEIRYAGTEQMWNAISFGNYWDLNAGKYTIYYSIYCEKGHSWTDATCIAPKQCVNCGLTEGDKLDHDYVDGICTGCGRADVNGLRKRPRLRQRIRNSCSSGSRS